MGILRAALLALIGVAAMGAKTAHAAGMPQLDSSTFVPQLIWLAISFAVLYLIMTRVALPRVGQVLDDRQARIDSDLKQAKASRDAAEQTAEAYRSALAEARSSAQQTLRDVNQQTTSEASDALGQMAGKLASDIEEAEIRIATARDQALAKIKAVSVEVALVATERLMGEAVEEAVVAKAVDQELKERG